METYFLNVVRATRIVTPIMKKQNGSIINISTFAVFERSEFFLLQLFSEQVYYLQKYIQMNMQNITLE